MTALPSIHKAALRRLDTGQDLVRPIAIQFLKALSPELTQIFLKRTISPEEIDKISSEFAARKPELQEKVVARGVITQSRGRGRIERESRQ